MGEIRCYECSKTEETLYECKECDNPVCIDHRYDCQRCNKQYCCDHIPETCTKCKKEICDKCMHNKDKKICNDCK